jgi:uncharacterized CHY-type Zn-finger protein
MVQFYKNESRLHMAISIDYYQCECGWSDEAISVLAKRQPSIYEKLEKQLCLASNKKAKAELRDVYHKLVKGEVCADELTVKQRLVICSHCKKSDHQEVFYHLKSHIPLNHALCTTCGNELQVFQQPQSLPCPKCQKPVQKGTKIPNREKLALLLKRCTIQFPEQTSQKVVIAIDEVAISNVQDCHSNIISMKKNELVERSPLEVEQLAKVLTNKKVFLHASFNSDFEAELTLLLLERFKHLNITPIIVIPPLFQGRKKVERIRELAGKMQKYCERTIQISGDYLKEQHGANKELFEVHLPQAVKKAVEQCNG